MINYFREIFEGAWSLAVGMGITFVRMFHHRVTLDYPYKSLKMTARYRGHIELQLDAQTRQPKCIVCMACQKACPSGCIRLDGQKPEGATRKVLTSYMLDFTTCSLCGLCVESCSFNALEFSREYNLASTCKQDYQMDLFKRAGEAK
ncbi:MAG: 4Fe-4S dicluster domain-containing protein [bacterium]